MSPRWRSIFPCRTSMIAPTVHRNGLPRIRGSFDSSSSSRTTKSAGTRVFPTRTWISSIIPTGDFTDRSANTRDILVGLKSVNPRRLATEYGMRLMLDPRSTSEHEKTVLPIWMDRTNFPGSPSFLILLFWRTALHSLETTMNSRSSVSFPEINPFTKLLMDGIIWIALMRGSLTVKSSSIFLHFISCLSLRVALAGTGYGTLGT